MRRTTRAALRCGAAFSLALLAALLAVDPAAAAPSPLNRAINQRVAEAKRVAPSLGVVVVEAESGAEVYSYHPDVPRILASNTKLFTTAAALALLPQDFVFDTPVLIRGAVDGGALDGDLAVVGSGDPSISGRFDDGDVYAVFRRWAAALRGRGVERVQGDLYLVDGRFETLAVHPDWPPDQLARWYEAPVGTFSFNDNCLLVRVAPGERPGAPARVELEPRLDLYSLASTAVTTSSARRQRLVVERRPDSHLISVSGAVYLRAAPYEAFVTVPDPGAYFGAALRAALAEEGVSVDGETRRVAELPGAVWERVTRHTTDLLTTLEVTNKRSQNLYAESLLKALAVAEAGEGSWRAGVEAVEGYLAASGLDGDGLSLADGSGLSRNNRATPRQVTRLLRHMFAHPRGRDFLRSLPFSGEEHPGWRRRLAWGPYRGNVFAKTGTLSGISTLSGYAKARSGKLYAFSILMNRSRAAWRARQAQDRIVQAIVDHG